MQLKNLAVTALVFVLFAPFSFADETGLLKFVTRDRAVLEFTDAADIEAKAERLRWLVRAWIAAT